MRKIIFARAPGCRLLVLLLSLLTVSRASAGGEPWPAMSFQIKTQEQAANLVTPRKGLTVSVVEVPAEEEAEFVGKLARQASARNAVSDSLLVVYRGDEPFAQDLEVKGRDSEPGKLVPFRLDQNGSEDRRGAGGPGPARAVAGQFSFEGVKRAGVWVAVAATGVGSALLYVSHGVAPATAGSMVLAFLNTLNIIHQPVMLRYYGGGEKIGERWAKRIAPGSERLEKAGGVLGASAAGFINQFISNGVLKLALNMGDVSAVLGSVELIADLSMVATFSVWSHSTWDMAFNRMRQRAPGEETERIIKMFNYGNRIFFMAMAPIVFAPATHMIGISILAVYGAIGAVAIVKDDVFFRAAERVVEKMENSVVVSRALAGAMEASERVRAALKPLGMSSSRPLVVQNRSRGTLLCSEIVL